ncbi:MAG: hypothetical protein KAI43_10155 [Candidatus Aureabacteria bacterium]|nr:hypothetical protein [Candidatus Auribacterota bacterium]
MKTNKIKLLKRIFLLVTVSVLFVAIGYNFIIRIDDCKIAEYNMKMPLSIQVPLNKLVLIRSGNNFGAFKLLRKASKSGFLNGAKYEYWYINDGNNDLTNSNVKHGTSFVFENYDKIPLNSLERRVVDRGSNLNIKVGILCVEWSRGNHIYTESYYDGEETTISSNFEITATNWSEVKEIDLSSKELRWIGEKTSFGKEGDVSHINLNGKRAKIREKK